MSFSLWELIDKLFLLTGDIKPLQSADTSIISVEIKKFRGARFSLSNGTVLEPGDNLVEIHLNSKWFINRRHRRDVENFVWQSLSDMSRDLAELAKRIKCGSYGKIKAIHGVTFLNRGALRLGFDITTLKKTPGTRLREFYQLRLMKSYYANTGMSSRTVNRKLTLYEVWLPVDELFHRYLVN